MVELNYGCGGGSLRPLLGGWITACVSFGVLDYSGLIRGLMIDGNGIGRPLKFTLDMCIEIALENW